MTRYRLFLSFNCSNLRLPPLCVISFLSHRNSTPCFFPTPSLAGVYRAPGGSAGPARQRQPLGSGSGSAAGRARPARRGGANIRRSLLPAPFRFRGAISASGHSRMEARVAQSAARLARQVRRGRGGRWSCRGGAWGAGGGEGWGTLRPRRVLWTRSLGSTWSPRRVSGTGAVAAVRWGVAAEAEGWSRPGEQAGAAAPPSASSIAKSRSEESERSGVPETPRRGVRACGSAHGTS